MLKDLKNDGLSEDIVKVGEAKIQDITNSFVTRIDELIDLKEIDIMKV